MLYLCLFLPASISVLVSEKLKKEKYDSKHLVIIYLSYAFIIATLMNTITYIVTDVKSTWYDPSTFTFGFSLQYTWLSLFFAIILPYLAYIFSKVVQIDVEVKECKKDVKKNKKNIHRHN